VTVGPRLDALWIELSSKLERGGGEAAMLERLGALHDDRPEYALRLHNARGLVLMAGGHDARAAASACELGSVLLPKITDPFLRTSFLNMAGHVMVVLARYEDALEFAAQQIAEGEMSGLDFVIDHALLTKAGAQTGLRRLGEAQRTLDELRNRGYGTAHIAVNAEIAGVRVRITRGDLQGAAILLQREPPSTTAPQLRGEFLGYRGLVSAAHGDAVDAAEALEEAQCLAGHVLTTALCQLALAVVSPRKTGQSAFDEAMRTGAVDSLVMTSRACPDFAAGLIGNPRRARALTAVLNASRDVDLGRRIGLVMPRELRRSEGLTPREREVYELLIEGRTNREIGLTLFISESTTKVHVRHIYEKLGVHSRTEAARATVVDDHEH
jgi:DNA-binding CsgD family transcriptional regulator